MRRLEESGAKYVISLPVRKNANQRVYRIVHASKSKQGLRTMKEAMDSALRAGYLPDDAIEAIRFELSVPVEDIVAQLRLRFGGLTVWWTEANNRGQVLTIKKYLLEETPVFPDQLGAIKESLVELDYRETKRPLTFRFPLES